MIREIIHTIFDVEYHIDYLFYKDYVILISYVFVLVSALCLANTIFEVGDGSFTFLAI